MRKIKSVIFVFAVSALALVSCSDSNDYTDKVSSVKVIEADTEIPASGGTATISVTGTGLTAEAADGWLNVSVDGNTIIASAPSNDGMQSRHTIVTITASNGDYAVVNVSQAGLVLVMEADGKYMFDAAKNDPVEFFDMSNIEYNVQISDEWIHLDKSDNGYSISVDDNEGDYRRGTIVITYHDFSKTIYVGQWGENLPDITTLNTAVYEDLDGVEHTKEISIVENGTRKWAIKGLFPEGDVDLLLSNQANADKQQYYIPSCFKVGTFNDVVNGDKYTLRCVMSAYDTNASGARYFPTSTLTSATNAYRMTFDWEIDDEANPTFAYTRPTQLGSSASSALSERYNTDGILGVIYSSTTSASALYRVGIIDELIHLRFAAY